MADNQSKVGIVISVDYETDSLRSQVVWPMRLSGRKNDETENSFRNGRMVYKNMN